jgi:diguanylate cyclase (GGDEF)-like protein/PAS domain S-box-containing protein
VRAARARARRAEAAEAAARAILDHTADAILTVDLDGRIESANPTVERLFDHRPADVVGRPLSALIVTDEPVGPALLGRRTDLPLGTELTGLRRDGSTFPLELSIDRLDLGGRTVATVVARDVTERRAFEQRLAHLGTHDALTGLPNRALFLDRLGHALANSQRARRPLAVLYCDLDRFKVVNDSLGHSAGDTLLVAVAERLHDTLRSADTVARLGGDEFAVLIEELTDQVDAAVVARKLAHALAEPIEVERQTLHVTASIGIAVWSPGDDECEPESLVRDADVAMFRAKSNGSRTYELFDAELRRQAVRRLETENALRHGIGLNQFRVHFQPEVALATGRVVGLEALVRWEHPDEGLVPPARFLAVAEETGLIVAIGVDVLGQACAEASRWHESHGEEAPTMWVNVSARQLADPGLVDVVASAVTKWLPSPDTLGLEITETDVVPDDDRSRRTVAELKELGVRVAIDDFGTGFASLAYLWRFPADVIKIDRSFVSRLDDDPDAGVLVSAMIDMAHSLGKRIVAEGVETDTQLDLLRSLGCDTVQGFLLHRPMPAAELVDVLG